MTKTILQEAIFENTTSSDLYEMFLSSKHHSNIRGGMPADIQPVEGSNWNINNGHLYGKILKLVKGKLIVLAWHSGVTTAEEDLDMIVVLHFLQSNKNAIIELTHTLIPDTERYEIYLKNWNDRYWTPWKDYINFLNNNQKNKNYTATIEVAQSAKEVFNAISDVTKWWSKDFEGNSTKLNDEFIINHPNQHYSKQKLIEVISYKKVVWIVTESKLDWIKNNKEEWTNTKMIFEISTKGDKRVLHFKHEGLVPEQECFQMCEKGWNIVIKDWLLHLITVGTPSPEMAKAPEIRNQHFGDKPATEKKNYHRTIMVNASPAEAMKKISQVNHWWKGDFSGSAEKLNDKFKVPFGELNGERSFVDFVVSEYEPNKKTVWKVTDCNLPWFNDKKEWNNTQVVFEISSERKKTKIDFTHIGLVHGVECYDACEKGWDGHVTNSLLSFINEGKGNPQ